MPSAPKSTVPTHREARGTGADIAGGLVLLKHLGLPLPDVPPAMRRDEERLAALPGARPNERGAAERENQSGARKVGFSSMEWNIMELLSSGTAIIVRRNWETTTE